MSSLPKIIGLGSLSIWAAINASLATYLTPLAIPNPIIKVAIMDSWLLASILCLTLAGDRKHKIKNRDSATSIAYCFLLFAALSSFSLGLIYKEHSNDSLREFRIFYHFLILHLFFYHQFRLNPKNLQNILLLTILGMMTGNLIYFLTTKLLFSDVTTYYLSSKHHAENIVDAFSPGIQQKFKYPPALIMLSQLVIYDLLQRKELSKPIFIALSGTLLVMAAMSNMRSVLGAYFISIIFILTQFSFRKRISTFQFLTAIAAISSSIIVFSNIDDIAKELGNSRFSTQITEKSISSSSDLANRFDGLLITFGAKDSKHQSFLGQGFGAAYDKSTWGETGLNPADSGFFHLLLSGGYLLLTAFMIFILLQGGRAIIRLKKSRSLLTTSFLLGYCISILNMFNDSPFLFISDAAVLGLITAYLQSNSIRHTTSTQTRRKNFR